MGRLQELFAQATLLGDKDVRSEARIELVQRRPTVSEIFKRRQAEAALEEEGFLGVLLALAEGMPKDRKAVVDFGYDEGDAINAVGALRWVPIEIEDGKAMSKALRLTSKSDGPVIEYPADSEGWGGSPKVAWQTVGFSKSEMGTPSFRDKLNLAILNANARIGDNRIYVNGKLERRPGIGKKT